MEAAPADGYAALSEDEGQELRRLYDVQGPELLRFLLRMTSGDAHRAEDILQETLLRAWRKPESRNPDGTFSRAWLFTVARNLAIDSHRHHGRVDLVAQWGDELVVEGDRTGHVVDAHELYAAIQSLPERLSSVLIEVFIHDRSGAEAAANLGIPVGTVKSRTFHALRALRQVLEERGYPFP